MPAYGGGAPGHELFFPMTKAAYTAPAIKAKPIIAAVIPTAAFAPSDNPEPDLAAFALASTGVIPGGVALDTRGLVVVVAVIVGASVVDMLVSGARVFGVVDACEVILK